MILNDLEKSHLNLPMFSSCQKHNQQFLDNPRSYRVITTLRFHHANRTIDDY